MGASGWGYYVTYQTDIQAALNLLRHQAFESGDYHRVGTKQHMVAETRQRLEHIEGEASDSYFQGVIRRGLETYLQQLEALPEPKDIDDQIHELFVINGEEGSHSILDITRATDTPDFGTASPLPLSEMVDLFGTDKPTHAMIDERKDDLMSWRDRWMATYIIVYKDDAPNEIYFAGNSGD